jgi:hypothetical protein
MNIKKLVLLIMGLMLAALIDSYGGEPSKENQSPATPLGVPIYLDHLSVPTPKTLEANLYPKGELTAGGSISSVWPDSALENSLGRTPDKATYTHVRLWIDQVYEKDTSVATMATALSRIHRASHPGSVKAIIVSMPSMPLPEP